MFFDRLGLANRFCYKTHRPIDPSTVLLSSSIAVQKEQRRPDGVKHQTFTSYYFGCGIILITTTTRNISFPQGISLIVDITPHVPTSHTAHLQISSGDRYWSHHSLITSLSIIDPLLTPYHSPILSATTHCSDPSRSFYPRQLSPVASWGPRSLVTSTQQASKHLTFSPGISTSTYHSPAWISLSLFHLTTYLGTNNLLPNPQIRC
ncbi:hypothetical protein F5Y09DRAFT_176719 [Xylaria sp. FL1042]|nr:hypothetical protein F5Y09DRAFT_176719 [Xylaria sp. FL1042]